MGWQPPQNSCAWRLPQWQQCLRAREAAAAPLCAPLIRNKEQFLLPAPSPAGGLSPVQILDVSTALCNDLFLFINLPSDICRTQTSWDILPGDRHQQSRDSEKAKLKDAVITVLHESIQCLSTCLLHILNVQVSNHCAA